VALITPTRNLPGGAGQLFLSVLLGMRLPSLFSVVSGMYRMAARSVSMMGGFLVLSCLMMLGSFSMMTGSMCVVL
jgi:hypothetical protein